MEKDKFDKQHKNDNQKPNDKPLAREDEPKVIHEQVDKESPVKEEVIQCKDENKDDTSTCTDAENNSQQAEQKSVVVDIKPDAKNISQAIRKMVENSETMLSYILDKGIDIDRNVVETIVKSKYTLDQGEWTASCEIDFRMAYKELTKLIFPVTVESLIASLPSPKDKVGKIAQFLGRDHLGALSSRSVNIYTSLTCITMIMLMVIQIYFYLGSTRLNNIQQCNQKIAQKETRKAELMLVLDNGAENSAISLENENLENELFELNAEKQCNIELLVPWIQYIRNITFNQNGNDIVSDVENAENTTAAAEDALIASVETIQEAQSYLLILGIYILPLIYGLIGGFTFVLRELISEIRGLTFSRGTNTKYLLRIILGAIAGLSVGLFWGDLEKTQQFGIASLSPMLLAFLAGYCVEYLFMFVEKFVLDFFKRNESSSEKSRDNAKETAKENHVEKINK